MRRIGLLALVLLLLAGCARPSTPTPAPVPQVEKAPTPSDPPPSSRLFLADGVYHFQLQEGYDGRAKEIEEEWVHEAGRLVATQSGRPYVSWLWRPDGVWRADPKNPKVLLRYLPRDLAESTWRQRSGDSWVYFRLREESYPNSAWVLTVLNRGERTEWRLGDSQQASAEDPAHPDAAFTKYGAFRQERPVSTERRAAILAAAPLPTGEQPAVETITSTQFVDALTAIAGYERREVNLDAEGPPESVVGVFTRTTWFGPELLDVNEKVLLRPGWYGREGRYTIATLGGQPRFLVQRSDYLEVHWVELRDGKWQAAYARDMGIKSDGTPATRSTLLPDGRVQVEWEPLHDPAKHRRIRHFTMTETDQVKWLDEAWAPAAGTLRRPESPLDLLQAFIFAQAYGLQEEAKSYLARPEMASQFPLADQPKPIYTEPEVGVGQVSGACEFKKGEAPASGPIPFFALYGMYEGFTLQHGTAQIGRAPDGRLVIASIAFGKSCYDGL